MEENNIPSMPNTSKNNNSLILIILVLALIIVGLVIFILFNNKTDNTTNGSTDNNIVENENNDDAGEIDDDNTSVTNNDSAVELSNDWKKFVVSINNKAISLPYSYKELKSLSGFSMKDIEEKNYLEGNHYKLENLYKNDKLALYTEILNDTKDSIQGIDTKISRIGQTKYMVTTSGAEAVVFPGNLTVNISITKDKIVSLFGEPDDISNYSDNNYNKDTYKYYINKTYKTFNYFQIDVVNGVIDEITLDHRSY